MRSLNDLEIVAIVIGDIEHFMPGLYQVQRAKKGKNKGNPFLNICRQLPPKTDVLKFDIYNYMSRLYISYQSERNSTESVISVYVLTVSSTGSIHDRVLPCMTSGPHKDP